MEMDSCSKKLLKSASGLRMVPLSDAYASPFALSEPPWIADEDVTMCFSCKIEFNFFNRKHHCRRCGKCFCDRCSHHMVHLKRMYFIDPVRHCYDCALISTSEIEFYDCSLKLLLKGANFIVYNCNSNKSEGKHKCNFSGNYRCIEFASLNKQELGYLLPKLLLVKIVAVEFISSNNVSDTGQPHPLGALITFKDAEDCLLSHQFKLSPVDVKVSLLWLSALQKAVNMMMESRAT